MHISDSRFVGEIYNKKSAIRLQLIQMLPRISLTVFFLLLFYYPVFSQYSFKTYSINEGLSSNSVLAIEMDSKGYLWVGTYFGLNRFDGENFKQYFFNSTSFNGQDQISDIYTDSKGRLWVGTFSNLYLYDEEKDEFQIINEQRIIVGEIAEAPDSTIWVVGYGAYIVDETNLSLTEVRLIGANNRKIEDIEFDSKGRIWLGWFNDGITMCRYVKIREKKELFIEKPFTSKNSENLKSDIVRDLFIDNNDKLWLTTYEGLNWIDLNKDEKDLRINSGSNQFSKARFWSVIQDQKGTIWAGSYGDGLYVIDQKGKSEVANIKTNLQNQKSISCNEIHVIYEDPHGNIWIGSENGLNKVILGEIEYKTYYNTPNNPQSISSNHIFQIYQSPKGKVWACTSEGLSMLDYNTNDKIFKRYYLSDTGYVENFILSLLPVENEETFFIGCRDGLYKYELGKQAQKIDLIKHKYNKSILTVREIVKIGTRLWLATDNGIHIYDFQSNNLDAYLDFGYQDLDCDDILYDNDNTVWLATNYGLKRILNPMDDFNKFQIREYIDSNSEKTNFSAVIQDNQNMIWIGSYKGAYMYNPVTDEYLHFNSQNGLKEDFISGLIEYENEIIVTGLSTISSISKTDYSIESYSFNTAITNMRESFYMASLNDGKIALGGINGLKVLDPGKLKKDSIHYPLVIQNLLVGNTSVQPYIDRRQKTIQNISTTSKIYLNSKFNTFTLEFSYLNFSAPTKFMYKYKLDGYDEDWRYVDNNQGFANYSKLSPGRYVFRVNATNSLGQWNEQDTDLEIHVLPPFWLKWYSILFYFIIIVVLLIFVRNELLIRYNLASEKLAKSEIEKKNKEQMRFFINISHELKTPLALINGPIEHMHRHIEKDDKLYQYSEWALNNTYRLTSIINEILDFRLLEADKLKPSLKTKNWEDFISSIHGYFNEMAIRKKIKYKLDNQIKGSYLFDISMIEKSIVNLLDNAFKYSPDNAEIKLSSFLEKESFSNNKDGIHVVCSNTGTSISDEDIEKIFERFYIAGNKECGGSGIGLSITKRFIELHGGKIWCQSDGVDQVEFHFTLPAIIENPDEESSSTSMDDSIYKKMYSEKSTTQNGKIQSENEKLLELQTSISQSRDENVKLFTDENLNGLEGELKNNKATVLLVEDDHNLIEFIASILNNKYQVLLASNGKEALEIVNTKVHPDLIISDIMMPLMDGFTLCDRIKADRITSHIPIILITARPEQYSLVDSYKHEANAYIEKPFTEELLTFCVKSILNQHAILRKYYGATLVDFHKKADNNDPNQEFLASLKKIILDNIDNSELSIDILCDEMSISKYMLYNKIKSITGKTPGQIIKTIRVHKAESLLKKGHNSIKEIQYVTGFNSAKSLRDAFKEEFGVLPSEYKEQASI